MLNVFKEEIQKTQNLMQQILQNKQILEVAELITKTCIATLKNNGKILFAGNGGSAADSQHLAAELVSKLCFNRPGLAAIALTTDTSALTAIGNDYSFENLFSRQVEALGQQNDVLIGISTSGKSPNILKAFAAARQKGLKTVGFTGAFTDHFSSVCDLVLSIPSKETPKIQECHIMMGHIICALIEEDLFGEEFNPNRKATVAAL